MSTQSYIYIHIPFCLKKCHYCDFCSFPVGKYSIDDYIQTLKKEIVFELSKGDIKYIQTIYIGGGTPSLLSIEQLECILSFREGLKVSNNVEITIEVNPATVDSAYFASIYDLGINRISLGVQSLDDKLLKILGRPHRATDVYRTIDSIKDAGFNNISIDLMYSLPEQTINQWEETLRKSVTLNVQHISAYGLKIEPGTLFNKLYSEDHKDIPPDEISEKMFLMTDLILTENGFNHYEISNYAKNKLFSRHNLNYWHNNSYFGFGLAAHSFIEGKRYENTSIMSEYMQNYKDYTVIRTPNRTELIEDEIFLNLRTSFGIDLKAFYQKHNILFTDKYKTILSKYNQYFEITEERVRLNLSGMLLSNIILSEFIEV